MNEPLMPYKKYNVKNYKWGVENNWTLEHMIVKCKKCGKEIKVPFQEPPNEHGYGCWGCWE